MVQDKFTVFRNNTFGRGNNDGGRVMNLIYVSHDIVYEVPSYLFEPLNKLELPGESIRTAYVIDQGEFGKVYIGEAKIANKNREWKTVAIKTLSGKDILLCNSCSMHILHGAFFPSYH